MSSPISEVKPSQVNQLIAENAKLKAQIEELKKRDEDAMELSQKQNDLFMTQLEEKDQEIADLKEKYEPKPHKFNIRDTIRYENKDCDNSYKFLQITGLSKCRYKVREIVNVKRHKTYIYGNREDFYVISKDEEVWQFSPHKNIGKKDMEIHGKLIDDCDDEGQNETEWIMNHNWHIM
jgi:hypothetical protein